MQPGHLRAHRVIWRVLIVLLPMALLGAAMLRPAGRDAAPPERLSVP